jgi:Beta propeller domain
MLLVGDRLVVFSSDWCNDNERRRRQLSSVMPYFGTQETRFTIYSTTNLGIIGSSQILPGSYINARAIGDDIYVVSMRYLNVYEFTGKLDPYTLTTEQMYSQNQKLTKEAYEAAAWTAAEANVDEFVTQLTAGVSSCDTLQQITLFQNSDTLHPYGTVAESIAHVTAFNVQTPTVTSVSSRVMPTSYWQMYASSDTMLLTAEGYYVGEDVAPETYVLAYKLADATATPIGVGKIPGVLLNQFSMDEHNGFLRFASTIRERFRYTVKWEAVTIADSDNLIVVLKADADLTEVGRLTGLGKEGETIQSVRFLGDRAFVVRPSPVQSSPSWHTILYVPVQVTESSHHIVRVS